MKIQELIRKYEELWEAHSPFHEPVPYTSMVELFLKELKQLDEPQKVKIPKLVADWIEECKNDDFHLFGAMEAISLNQKKLDYWFREDDNMELFARAWLDGHEVEKEKKYKITLLNRNDGDLYLINQNAGVSDKYGHFSPVVLLFTKGTNFSERCYKLTKKEVASNGFGWVFDCPGIKIEEVE